MRLATGVVGERVAFGPVVDGELCDISADGPWRTLADALGSDQRAAVDDVARHAARIALDHVALLPPIPLPRRILCVGLNYHDHVGESASIAPKGPFPTMFTRFASSIVGHGAPLVRPAATTELDWEGELAVIIGTKARSVPRERAFDVIAGYSCFMDGSLRDYQRHTSQFTPGKNFDRSGSFGPWIVTPDECDLSATTLSTRVNGETMQKARIAEMIHPIDAVVAYCSTFTTLEPGDVIATGTPGGVGYARDPQVWLCPGDVVEVDISGIGVLRNPVIDE